jgi:hypothetical protein
MSEEADPVELAIEDAKNFLRANGVFTWDQWQQTDAQNKAIIVEAAEQLDVERAALLAVALSSDAGVERVMTKLDNGDALVRRGLVDSVAKALTRTKL